MTRSSKPSRSNWLKILNMVTESDAKAAKQRISSRLPWPEGVQGISVQRDKDGDYYIAVLVDRPGRELGNFARTEPPCRIEIVVSGPLKAL